MAIGYFDRWFFLRVSFYQNFDLTQYAFDIWKGFLVEKNGPKSAKIWGIFFFQTHQFFMISFSLGSQEYRMIPFLSFLDKVLSKKKFKPAHYKQNHCITWPKVCMGSTKMRVWASLWASSSLPNIFFGWTTGPSGKEINPKP